jgi:hypothetical protein
MSTVTTLVINILPLFGIIGLGYIAGRTLQVDLRSMASLAIYIFAPIVVLGAMARIEFEPAYSFLPLVSFAIGGIITYSLFYLTRAFFLKGAMPNLVGLGSVGGNTGYFGLPLVIALYGPEWTGPYILLNVGTQLTEYFIGYYLAVRSQSSIKDSIKKVLKLPAMHALYIGLIINFTGTDLPETFYVYWTYATGAWVFIGMMIIGVALSQMQRLEFDLKLVTWLFISKFVCWPAFGIAAILIAAQFDYFGMDPVFAGLIAIYVSVPLMSNLVAYAAQLNIHPEKVALAVLISTVFAIVYMPALFYILQTCNIMP